MDPKLIEAADIQRAARVLGLDLAPAHVPGVVANFRMIAGIAAALNEFPLGKDTESAAVFVPCSPPTAQ